jgi:hypothetical protein
MSVDMTGQPTLSAAEWALLIELLEHERVHLPVEIRHTRTHAFRDSLRQRLEDVDRLLQRLQVVHAGEKE